DQLISLVPAAFGAWRYGTSMFLDMVAYGFSVLAVGFLGAPRADPAAWRLATGAGCAAAVVAASVWMDQLERCRLVAAAAIALLSYGIVAAGRAALFQRIAWAPGDAATIPLHYHTFPSIGLVVCLCLAWCTVDVRRTAWIAFARVAACGWLI